ncbi:unnamed protein product [Adineta steineri]|uniref:Apple domain-containing protein n=1 Tax=Adineta steineri TaxID=433720 RepID=A0A813V9U1_9BILA|nr:unnamed protein product [Adineta steineri]CAF1101022.1 unnamed protein product [Adineta steineri]
MILLDGSSNIDQFNFGLCTAGLEFSPFDEQILLFETNTDSLIRCAIQCDMAARCRTFNFDRQTKDCYLYEGDIDSTGLVVASLSPPSVCGWIKLDMSDFANYGSPCSTCEDSRYLTCINATCQCQPHTFFNGSMCLSQKLNGTGCTSDNQCRNDLNLTCLSHMQCGLHRQVRAPPADRHQPPAVRRQVRAPPADRLLTTTKPLFNCSCLNQTWISSSNRLAQWLFDGNLFDQMNNYNMTSTKPVSYTSSGYNQQAVIFASNNNFTLVTPYMPLSSVSFTIDTWLFITALSNKTTYSIFSLCYQMATNQCLILGIRQSYLYMSFFPDQCSGVTQLKLNTWIHVAFVFDLSTLTKLIYLNGVLENSCSSSSILSIPTSTNITIGRIPLLTSIYNVTSFQGNIDQMTVSTRVKSSCEILDIATLVAHFTFDNGLFLNDSGPNYLQAITLGTSSFASGRFSQAIAFNGTQHSIFQVSGFTALGIANKPYSISLWFRPISLLGIVVHVSTLSSGTGWCEPFLGFAPNGSFVAQSYCGGVVTVANPTLSIATLVWSHVVQTWSSTNGLCLYVNNVRVTPCLSSAITYDASSAVNLITLGSSFDATTAGCGMGQIDPSPYKGEIDDFRVYSRELSACDVTTLYYN